MFEQVYRYTTKLIAAIYVVMAARLLWSGTQPDAYLINARGITETQPYPVWPVGLQLLILALLYMALAWALRAHSWTRVWKLLVCLVPGATLTVFAAITILHAPPYHVSFLFAVFLLTLLVLLTLLLFTVLGLSKKLTDNTTGNA